MASLTPGLLSKLLDNAGNKEVRVTGEHRSALLQVIEIVPSLSGVPNDPWHSRGFFLKLSDSLHSAYASISDEDLDLIYSDKIQLGQFVYVSRFDISPSGSPVPLLRGLKPVPNKRRPCVGNPTDLVSCDMLPNIRPGSRAVVDFSCKKEKLLAPSKVNVRKSEVDYCKNRRRDSLSLENCKKVPQEGGLETRRLSLDSARRIWDHQIPTPKTVPLNKSSRKNLVHSDRKVPSKIDSSVKSPSLSVSPLKSKNGTSLSNSTVKPSKKDFRSTTIHAIPNHFVQVPLSSKTSIEHRISWAAIPPAIHNLAKVRSQTQLMGTLRCRNAAVLATARALEEAAATENVICCLQAYAELRESARSVSSGALVEQYLDLYQRMLKAAKMVNSLLGASLPETKSSNRDIPQLLSPGVSNSNAASWVRTAVQTNLSKFSLFKNPEKSEISRSTTCHYVILDDSMAEKKSGNQLPQNKPSPRNCSNFIPDSSAKLMPSPSKRHFASLKKTNPEKWDCPKGNRLKKAANLAEELILQSTEWFLTYLDNSLKLGFGLCRGRSSESAYLLEQLKRVDKWLDDLVGSGVEVCLRIKGLKKKLCGFLLEHVDCGTVNGK